MTVPSRTGLAAFSASRAFEFQQANTTPRALQKGRAGERCLTPSAPFLNQVVLRDPARFRLIEARATLPCLPRERWAEADLAGRRVLFLLPSEALGNNVCILLFLHALAEQRRPAAIGVLGARSAADIFHAGKLAEVYPLWIGERDLARWDTIVDLGHLEERQNIELWPVDMEGELLAAFTLQPAARFPAEARPLRRGRLRIGLFPLASSPLRTLPPPATLALAEALAPLGELTLSLNRNQRQGLRHAEAVAGRLPAGTKIVEAYPSVGALLHSIDRFDYAVFADSGPAHMSKLYALPGVAVYSSAPGAVLQGRFRNLAEWTVPFVGPHCATPCGLAKLRETADGRIGCMGSLGVAVEQLPASPKTADPAAVDRFLADPVPCLAQLARDPAPLADFVLADLSRRLAPVPVSSP